MLPDGSLVFVESYRSQLTIIGADRTPRQFAYVTGAPNSCVLGADGEIYVCQNGGTVGSVARQGDDDALDPARAPGRRRGDHRHRGRMASRSTAPTISSSPPTDG